METDGRSAIVIKPRQPYADWAESVNEPGDPPANLDSLPRETTVHIEEIVTPEHLLEILELEYEDMLREQLNGWHTIQS